MQFVYDIYRASVKNILISFSIIFLDAALKFKFLVYFIEIYLMLIYYKFL